jgi:hypothetical protein
MKNIRSFESFVNEGVRDQMTPKGKEDIKKSLEGSPALTVLKGIEEHDLGGVYTEDELDGYMEESDSTQIYSYFKDMVRRNEFEKVKRIMDKWNISFRNQDTNLVEYAVMSGNLEMVKYLFEKGLKADIIFDYLFDMMKRGADKEIIKYILSQSSELQRGFQEKKRIIKWETETIEKYS